MSFLMGCENVEAPQPQPEPVVVVAKPTARPELATPSAASNALRAYYQDQETSLETRGLLRIDGGNVETSFTSEDVARSFSEIAFQNGFGLLRKWQEPVRIFLEFGSAVDNAQKQKDIAEYRRYVRRLARLTDHPIELVSSKASANFLVLTTSTDEGDFARTQANAFAPALGRNALGLIANMPRSIQCLVYAYGDGTTHKRSVVVIRDELPGRLRQACIHEELAQGLGLGTDSPKAYPSIFNDDDEFALLTTHDEALLKLLYDPALPAGISLDDARPIIRRILELPPLSG